MDEDENERRKTIQNLVCEALKDPIYQECKQDERNPFVRFLHTAAEIIHNQSEGMSVFQTYGEYLLSGREVADESDYTTLYRCMQQAVDRSSDANVDTLVGRLGSHALSHPRRASATFLSQLPFFGLRLYDAYDTGNYNAALGSYCIGDAVIGTSAGPNPSHEDYAIFAAIQQRNTNLAKIFHHHGPRFVQVVLEGAEKHAGAVERRDSIIATAERHAPTSAVALPLDGAAWKGGKAFANVRTAREFTALIRLNLVALGFRIPRLLSPAAVDRAIARFEETFQHFEGTEEWNILAENKELCKTLLLGFNACLILEVLQTIAAENPTSVQLGQLTIRSICNIACKQGIDRGAIQNLLVRMLVDAHAKGRFSVSKEQLHQYCGYLAGRAVSVEDRRIQKDRCDALLNFVFLIAPECHTEEKKQERERRQQAFLKALDLPPTMRFVPSHRPI